MSQVDRSVRPAASYGLPSTRGAGALAAAAFAAPAVPLAFPADWRDHTAITPAEVELFVAQVLGPDDGATDTAVEALRRRGATVEQLYLELLSPTAHILGERWASDRCDFVAVTVALGRLQRVVRGLSHVFLTEGAYGRRPGATAGTPEGTATHGGEDEPSAPPVSALLTVAPGDQHTLGLFLLSEFFVRDGWGVGMGPPLGDGELHALLREQWYDMVGFSVACDSRLTRLAREIRQVRRCARNRRILVLVGGRVFNDRPTLVARVGADGSAGDAASAPQVARRLLAGRERSRQPSHDGPRAGASRDAVS